MSPINSIETRKQIAEAISASIKVVQEHNPNHFDIDAFNESVDRKLNKLLSGKQARFRMALYTPIHEDGAYQTPSNLFTALVLMYIQGQFSDKSFNRLINNVTDQHVIAYVDDEMFDFIPPSAHGRSSVRRSYVNVNNISLCDDLMRMNVINGLIASY